MISKTQEENHIAETDKCNPWDLKGLLNSRYRNSLIKRITQDIAIAVGEASVLRYIEKQSLKSGTNEKEMKLTEEFLEEVSNFSLEDKRFRQKLKKFLEKF